MGTRRYRVTGAATYLDRSGNVFPITVNFAIDAPDAETAKTLVLAELKIRKGADASYDPAARWREPWNVQVEDETAKREAIEASGLTAGCKVLHKGGGSAKRGADARIGVVQNVYTVVKRGKITVRAAVDWPAPNRINGDGWHRSDVLASALVLATPEEIERRRSLNRAINERNNEHSRQMAAALDAELAERGLRLARGVESRSVDAINVKISNGCNVWALPLILPA